MAYPGTGGAKVFVLGGRDEAFREIALITQVFAPIRVAPAGGSGWRDLLVHVSGGGREAGERLLGYADSGYPSNASDAPVADPAVVQAAGAPIISAEAGTWDAARLLVPEGCADGSAEAVAPEGCEPDAILASESIGKVKIKARRSVILQEFRKPANDPKNDPELAEYWDDDHAAHKEWRFPELGATVRVVGETDRGPWRAETITIEAPSTHTTAKQIGIGASVEQVTAAYLVRPWGRTRTGRRGYSSGTSTRACISTSTSKGRSNGSRSAAPKPNDLIRD